MRVLFDRPRWHLPAMLLVTILVVAPNVYLAGRSIGIIATGAPAVDWHHFSEAGHRVTAGGLYSFAADYGYRYSPVLAYGFGVLSPIGDTVWRLLHVVAALALPTWPMRLVTLASWPFWFDVEAGNVIVFVVLAAAWALRGNKIGIGTFLAMAILMPRPLMLPVLAWILWRQPDWRWPFAGLLAIHLMAVLATGWGPAWLETLVLSTDEMSSPLNVGPSRWLGGVWLPVGVPLAAWLTLRGRLGLASLAISPYWLPYYLLLPVLELDPLARLRVARKAPGAPPQEPRTPRTSPHPVPPR